MTVIVLSVLLSLALFGCVAHLIKGPDRKLAGMGLAFTAALFLAIAFLPLPESGWWVALIIIATIIFVLGTLLSLVDMPENDKGELAHRVLWGKLSDPSDPNSGPKTPPVRIVQLVCVGLIVLVMVITWIARSTSDLMAEGDAPREETTSSAPPSTSTSPAPSSTTSAPPSSSQTSTPLGCNAPTLNPLSKTIPFKGTDQLQVCYDNQWKAWEGEHPPTVTLTAWKEDGGYGYARFKIGDTEYLIRTTSF